MSTYRFEDENHLHYLIIVREPNQESRYFLADKGGELVRVGVTRNVDSILGHVGFAGILAGAS